MAASGIMDFCRRRKLFVVAGILLLVGVAGFLHLRRQQGIKREQLRSELLEKHKKTQGAVSKVMKDMKDVAASKKASKKNPPPLRALPPIISRDKFKKRRKKPKLSKIKKKPAQEKVKILKPPENHLPPKKDVFPEKKEEVEEKMVMMGESPELPVDPVAKEMAPEKWAEWDGQGEKAAKGVDKTPIEPRKDGGIDGVLPGGGRGGVGGDRPGNPPWGPVDDNHPASDRGGLPSDAGPQGQGQGQGQRPQQLPDGGRPLQSWNPDQPGQNVGGLPQRVRPGGPDQAGQLNQLPNRPGGNWPDQPGRLGGRGRSGRLGGGNLRKQQQQQQRGGNNWRDRYNQPNNNNNNNNRPGGADQVRGQQDLSPPSLPPVGGNWSPNLNSSVSGRQGNPPLEPGFPPNQPGGPPDGNNANANPPVARRPAAPHTSLYVPSSMPLGEPLSSPPHTERQRAVVEAFKHAWKGYKTGAWGKDELNPISGTFSSSSFDMGMTLVDSLDTIWLMGLREEFSEAREWVANSLNLERNRNTVSLFETTIRLLGGLLSAYHLSQDQVFLDKAITLGSKLLPAFNTPSGIPSNLISLSSQRGQGRTITVAEAGTLQLEFRDLSRASGNPAYQEKCDRAENRILSGSQSRGLVRQTLDTKSGQSSGMYSAGAGVDSYYEYLIKQWIQSGGAEIKFRDAHERAVHEVLTYLLGHSQPSHMAFLGRRFDVSVHGRPTPTMDHLSCFYPGVLALGAMFEVMPDSRGVAANLTHTCYHMYEASAPTHLAPEIFQFNTNPQARSDIQPSSDAQNIQRPETVESLFLMYRLTKDQRYRDWGWEIFQAFEKYTKVERGGYASLRSVYTPGSFRDRMESFFLSETLKYLFLLFGDDDSVLSLREWVFNTEAHPLPVWRKGGPGGGGGGRVELP